jgi:hypothetical protein
MREPTDPVNHARPAGRVETGAVADRTDLAGPDKLSLRMSRTSGLGPLLAEAEAVWRSRAEGSATADAALPAWRPFEDAFPTFYQFTNRPPR